MCAWEPVPQCGRRWTASSPIWPTVRKKSAAVIAPSLQARGRKTERQHPRQWFPAQQM